LTAARLRQTPRIESILPTVAFLAALLLIAEGCRRGGLFDWLGGRIAASEAGGPRRLLVAVFVVVSVATALLNLDATVLILTPIVLVAVTHLKLDDRLYTISTAHLANSASLLLPVSNLTNLLVFHESGLSFTRFAILMLLPWLGAIVVEWLLLPRLIPRREVPDVPERVPAVYPAAKLDRWPVIVLAGILFGFLASGAVGIEPIWFAWVGALLITIPALMRGVMSAREVVTTIKPWFLLFVLGLGLVADLLNRIGLDDFFASNLPSGDGFGALLVMAAVAALLANLINNLPATLVLAPAVASLGEGPLLAMLIGVGIGPNLTYLGSVANLLWRRVMNDAGRAPTAWEFTRAGLVTTPVALLVSTTLLWAALQANV